MYQVVLSNRAERDLKKIDKRFQQKIRIQFNLLENNPFYGRKMAGDPNAYKIKIPPIRIVYRVNFADKIIVVITIGHRGDVYKKL